MANRTKSSLRIFSSVDDAQPIDTALGFNRTRWHPKDSVVARVGEELTGEKRSVWIWDSPTSESLGPTEHVETLLDKLEENAVDLKAILADLTAEADIYIGYFSSEEMGGVTIDSHLVGRLGNHGLGIIVNLYLSDDPEPPS